MTQWCDIYLVWIELWLPTAFLSTLFNTVTCDFLFTMLTWFTVSGRGHIHGVTHLAGRTGVAVVFTLVTLIGTNSTPLLKQGPTHTEISRGTDVTFCYVEGYALCCSSCTDIACCTIRSLCCHGVRLLVTVTTCRALLTIFCSGHLEDDGESSNGAGLWVGCSVRTEVSSWTLVIPSEGHIVSVVQL